MPNVIIMLDVKGIKMTGNWSIITSSFSNLLTSQIFHYMSNVLMDEKIRFGANQHINLFHAHISKKDDEY